MSIVTKGGDSGETSLLYGGRVAKDDLHTEAYGALDEATSALGLARAHDAGGAHSEAILALQRDLFTVGAELATDPAQRQKLAKHFPVVDGAMVAHLDAAIADLEAQVQLPESFVIPGGSVVGAALDLARTFVRRAERRAVALRRDGGLTNTEVLRYLNRCSDYLFMLARSAEAGATTAQPRSVRPSA